jgi:hypothetical protein
MPTIITASELRTVLGVSSSLYSDSILNDIIDTSETVVLPLLVKYFAPIGRAELVSNVAIFTTVGEHKFDIGQSVVVAGVSATLNATYTITDVSEDLTEFSVAKTNADILPFNVIPSGTATLSSASTYVGNSAVEQAVIVVSVEVFQSRTAAGGQIEGVDFAPSPYRMGRSLYSRVSGLLGSYIDVESIVG